MPQSIQLGHLKLLTLTLQTHQIPTILTASQIPTLLTIILGTTLLMITIITQDIQHLVFNPTIHVDSNLTNSPHAPIIIHTKTKIIPDHLDNSPHFIQIIPHTPLTTIHIHAITLLILLNSTTQKTTPADLEPIPTPIPLKTFFPLLLL